MNMILEITLRLFVALLLGGVIGIEREYRSKEAGFRTHFLVALGSALFCVVSQYTQYGLLMMNMPGYLNAVRVNNWRYGCGGSAWGSRLPVPENCRHWHRRYCVSWPPSEIT